MAVAVTGFAGGCGSHATGQSGRTGSAITMDQLPPGVAGARAHRIHLSDGRGGRFDTASLTGRPYVVTFLYVNCPDVCPIIADELRQALADLGPRADRAAVVAVSVDPRGDTRPAVASFLRRHREPANFHYLIGSEAQLKPTWNAYYAAPQIPGDPHSSHTAAIWMVDSRGRIAGKFSAGTTVSPRDIAAALRKLLS